jgi:lysophospholipase L1-like esterase
MQVNTPKMTRWLVVTTVLMAISTPLMANEKADHDAVRPVPRSGGWMKRHESFNKRVQAGKVDLVFIGDSITQGWEGNGKKVWQKYYGKRNTVNLGIGGDRTQHVIWRLDNGNLKGISPKLAVIMIGTNNSGNNTSAQIAEGVEVIVDQLKKKTPQTKVLILAVFPRGKDANDKRRKVNEGANQGMAKLADGKQVHYLDIGDKFLAKDKTLSREIMPDLLHLSPQGYEIWAASIESMVAKLLGE